jgi:hypothetical protein
LRCPGSSRPIDITEIRSHRIGLRAIVKASRSDQAADPAAGSVPDKAPCTGREPA